MEFWLLILIAVLEVVDGQGIALRILRVLTGLIGGINNAEETQKIKQITNQKSRHG